MELGAGPGTRSGSPIVPYLGSVVVVRATVANSHAVVKAHRTLSSRAIRLQMHLNVHPAHQLNVSPRADTGRVAVVLNYPLSKAFGPTRAVSRLSQQQHSVY